ncbi:hypothetical protein B6N38_10000 [Cutibacterium avidum]|nr:hypothetical protein H639_03615 [Cutibacterium avidum TM16]OIJ76419.1 hypothetical protein APY06_00510 [Cutibacterium avidum]PGX67591.1 hypothetical protein B6N39_10460 [Cutibacterium avidum]PGX68544.1 hypothetical protein B6N38_10000 [Cutibacterium avidum]
MAVDVICEVAVDLACGTGSDDGDVTVPGDVTPTGTASSTPMFTHPPRGLIAALSQAAPRKDTRKPRCHHLDDQMTWTRPQDELLCQIVGKITKMNPFFVIHGVFRWRHDTISWQPKGSFVKV